MKGFRCLAGGATLDLGQDACVVCGRCVEVCPHQLFEVTDGLAGIVALDACMECGACARNCPASAVRVDSGVGCAAGLMAEWFRDRKLRSTPGGC